MLTAEDLSLRAGVLDGGRILVTGGGTGLGRMIANGCAALGAMVYICGRRTAVMDATAEEINAALAGRSNGRMVALTCDVRDADAVEAMIEAIWTDGPLTGLVNNAAGNFISRTEDLSVRAYDAVANIVARGTFVTTLACGRRWLAAGDRASVLSISARYAQSGGPYTAPSAMGKAAVENLMQTLAVEWGGRGIRLNSICPGAIPTEGAYRHLLPGRSAHAEIEAGTSTINPMGRVGRPAELANLAAFLLAPGSGFISGQSIAIDGAGHQAVSAPLWQRSKDWTDDQWRALKDATRGGR